ncbi:F-box only protein 6-like [Onthophagus taurus]|uniref:F-box only protein 6-like n=1 Tax=Onthophagus taurus TaxID=166361 RepID=UPI000C208483|nr:F-box only protein 6-like [Onthophagus taurus]
MINFIKHTLLERFMESPRYEYEQLNGRVLSNSIIPDDLISKIFEYLPRKDILKARLVCKNWDTLSVETIHHLYQTRFHKSTENLSLRYLIIRLYGNVFNRNLLQNVNGETKFKHWKILWNDGDKFKIENPPSGSPPLPDAPEFKGHTSCFATSYRPCEKIQVVDTSGDDDVGFVMKHRVTVHASEWVCARFDCGAAYWVKLSLKGKDGTVQEVVGEHREEQWCNPEWKKIVLDIDSNSANVESIEFRHCGQDTQFWAGHYGMKMAGAVVKLIPID